MKGKLRVQMQGTAWCRISIVLLAFATVQVAGAAEQGTEWLPIGAAGGQGAAVQVTTADAVLNHGLTVHVAAPGVLRRTVLASDANKYDVLDVPGCGRAAAQIGEPELPVKSFFVEIPYGVDVELSLEKPSEVSLGDGFTVHPLQPPLPDVHDAPVPPFAIDLSAYSKDRWFPEQSVTVGEPCFIRGRRVVFVRAFPLRYNPSTTELVAVEPLRFMLRYRGAVDPAGEQRKQRLASDPFEALAQDMIINADPITAPRIDATEPDLASGYGADYLIIAADAFVDEVLPLAVWKHAKGFRTLLVDTSTTGSTDTAIMNYIQSAYDSWSPAPTYVLLVGDQDDLPGHDILGHPYHGGNHHWPSDNLYACLDGSDLLPDLFLGRISVGTEAEATTVVDKILAYDRTPALGTWYDDYLVAGYFQDYDDDNGEADRWFMETGMTAYDFMVSVKGFTGHTALCTSYWPLHYSTWHFCSSSYSHRGTLNQLRWGCPGDYPDPVPSWIVSLWTSASQATTDISTAVNSGVGLIQHRDHGATSGWGDPPFYTSDVDALTNAEKTPVVLSVNCQTGAFDQGTCFAEAWQRHSNGGAVGIVAATRVSYSGPNDLLSHGIYDCMYPDYDTSYSDATYPTSWRTAEALVFAKLYMYGFSSGSSTAQLTCNLFHWFGDPEMMLRTDTPLTLTVTHPSTVGYGKPVDVTVTVDHGPTPVEGARVCISHPTVPDHWSGLTDATGSITFSGIVCSQIGDYDLVATCQNGYPYESLITAVVTSTGVVDLDEVYYGCPDTVGIQLADLDLAGTGTHAVSLSATGGDFETVVLTETGPATAVFTGVISTSSGSGSTEDGALQVGNVETITCSYEDADDGTGSPATATDNAQVDGQGPVISNVQTSGVVTNAAQVSFDTDELSVGRVRCGETAGGPYPIQLENLTQATSHAFNLESLLPETTYYFEVEAEDPAANVTIDDNGGACYSFTTPAVPDCFTEVFSGDNDLDNFTLTLIPDGSADYYAATCASASAYPSDPSGATALTLSDDGTENISLTGQQVYLYGVGYSSFYVCANGSITFASGDSDYTESIDDHFNDPRISVMWDDLGPHQGGTVSWEQLGDRAPDEVDLVLLDMAMPVMNGERAYAELRTIRKDIPVILSSGYGEEDTVERFAGKGLAGFIQKPYSPLDLIAAIRDILEGRQPTL